MNIAFGIMGLFLLILGLWALRENYKHSLGWSEECIKRGNKIVVATLLFSCFLFILMLVG
ncbi:hypothetical protein D6D85_00340 [Candidatus Methanodesulfokora washburnensis]|uniref:Uncharacterized protein n=1 Tax=Candidatus Methanodesulfokora washburnensis TaxID=2478471 RepID=A0A3R9R1T8_9CREN|nr:hypothetical protein D6D85_00340 [Candidatus Methanodesulfokores washburnensis]